MKVNGGQPSTLRPLRSQLVFSLQSCPTLSARAWTASYWPRPVQVRIVTHLGREKKTSAYIHRCVFRELMQCVCSPGLCLRRATDVAFPFQPLHLLPLCCPGRFCLRSTIQTMPATVTASIKATAIFPICEESSPFARSALCKKEHTLATGAAATRTRGNFFCRKCCLPEHRYVFIPPSGQS